MKLNNFYIMVQADNILFKGRKPRLIEAYWHTQGHTVSLRDKQLN